LTLKYLKGRPSLRTVCLLVDCRRGIGDFDKLIMKELDEAAVSWILVLTKTDKLNIEEIENIKDVSNKVISKHPAAYPEIMITSSLKNNGIDLLRTYLASFA
jgi:GTP-binding protein